MQSNMDRLILTALQEDIPTEDISVNAIITNYTKGKAELLCKQDGIIAGLDVSPGPSPSSTTRPK